MMIEILFQNHYYLTKNKQEIKIKLKNINNFKQ
jgi:hypothetical protein